MKLQSGEEIIHKLQPESSILAIWFFSKVIVSVMLGTFLTFWCFGFFGGMFSAMTESGGISVIRTAGKTAVVVGMILVPLGLIYCSYLRKTYCYYVTNQRCMFHGGIIRRVKRSVPYHKVTDVEQSQNIVERVLGISSIKIFTPGTASMWNSPFGGQRAELTFQGLKDNEAPAVTINEWVRRSKTGPHE